jgi:hypothetical protein
MPRLIFSILTRSDKEPKSLSRLLGWLNEAYDSEREDSQPYCVVGKDKTSIYTGHQDNLNQIIIDYGEIDDKDVIVFIHDDVEILSTYAEVFDLLTKVCSKDKTGIVGVAGSCDFRDGIWWNARNYGASRGLVMQGPDNCNMVPNWFGQICGQAVVLDGLFLAMTYKRLKEIGLDKPHYLSSNWDFYDIHLTLKSHLLGYNNYVLPILIRHESNGQMREEWAKSRLEFIKFHKGNLPCSINYAKTHGILN